MIVECQECGEHYDDARLLTYCPHDPFLTEFEAAQKDCAISLIGKPIRFHHQWKTGPDHRVQSVNFVGMVTLVDMVGEFAPYLFVVESWPTASMAIPTSAFASPATAARSRIIHVVANPWIRCAKRICWRRTSLFLL